MSTCKFPPAKGNYLKVVHISINVNNSFDKILQNDLDI